MASQARSEIIGYISTDPNQPDKEVVQDEENVPIDNEKVDEGVVVSGGSSASVYSGNISTIKQKVEIEPEESEQPIVLGFDRLPENTLVRDESKRIYIIKGDIKKVIWDLEELHLYCDQVIVDLSYSDLSEYPTRRFYNNKLIRQIGDERVYLVEEGLKKHIKTLEELKNNHPGKKIYNIPANEMSYY
ncbi:hypothetical protein C0583_06995 [Candidatus Parcubacteria bacterium]|nr:MAG: hypothetical protein C0583_06995 [Candidatus Parcubacteria bacterium]